MSVLYELRQRRPDLLKKHEVYIDGGIRRGTDVLKALCLGARGVGLGRPFLWGNSVWGEEGCRRVIESEYHCSLLDSFWRLCVSTGPITDFACFAIVLAVMREEIATGMRLLGVTSLDQLTPDLVQYIDRDPVRPR